VVNGRARSPSDGARGLELVETAKRGEHEHEHEHDHDHEQEHEGVEARVPTRNRSAIAADDRPPLHFGVLRHVLSLFEIGQHGRVLRG